jgi:hypothetical protein
MKKDIEIPKVENIAMAVVKENDSDEWFAHLINLKPEQIHHILVVSKGYGMQEGEDVKTSVLRHYWEELDGNSFLKVEPIMPKLFGISNEYWVSFYIDRTIYDKKYIFLPETIIDNNLTDIPVIGKKGIMIK